MSKLTCPIRGILNIEEKAKDGINFTEEKRRIDLIRFLLSRGYSKNQIKTEHVFKFGNGGKNKLIADLIVENDNGILLVAEVKRNSKDKESAIKNQLIPAMKLGESEYGIYFDGFKNELFIKDFTFKKTFDIARMPRNGEGFNAVKLTYNNLLPIENGSKIFDELDQLVHNLGFRKEERYLGLFQVILAKYFDEQFNKEELKFISNIKSLGLFHELWKETYEYYKNGLNEGVKLPNKIIFKQEKVIMKIIEIIEGYSFIKSPSKIAQDFFMKFGSKLLQKEMAQFYTPIPIVEFIVSFLDIKPNHFIIDPAGGSADFLTGVIQKYKEKSNYQGIRDNLHYWDLSKDAASIAFFNMVLNGDGRTKIKVLDSIEKHNKSNNKFDFVITNPPFGSKVKWEKDPSIMEHYDLSFGKQQQLGILFIERSMKLLKNNGVMSIILPSGYINNKTTTFIRKYLLDNFRIVADISLPDGAFKGSNTGVKTDLLIVQKTKTNKNYKIFTDVVKKIGFDYKKQKLPIKYMVNPNDGTFILDENNNNIVDTDLKIISDKLKKFAYDENIKNMEKNDTDIEYDFIKTDDLDETLKIKPELQTKKLKETLSSNYFSLKEYLKKNDASHLVINNSTPNIKNKISDKDNYVYIPIGEAGKGLYSLKNKLKGWELKKTERARQIAVKDTIYLSYLLGSSKTFFLFNSTEKNVIVTTGFFGVWIKNEKIRLSFYKFLFSSSFQEQFEAFATGHIQTNIIQERILDFKFPILDEEEIEKIKLMLNNVNHFITMRENSEKNNK